MTREPPPVVYVVCEAEYDARAAVAVFTNAPAAEQHASDCSDVASGAFRCNYEVVPLPFLGVVPQRALLHIHAAHVRINGSQVEDEQTWTVDKWDYDIPAEPVVSVDDRRTDMHRVHVAAATPEAAEAAFREAVEKVRQS